MKNKIFTQWMSALALLIGTSFVATAQNFGTGTGWGNLGIGAPIVVEENFQGYEFFYSWDNPDHGNSLHILDETSGTIVAGYKELVDTFNFANSSAECVFDFYQCAFAPDWETAYAYANALENTANVSNGFVEISREDSVYYERYGGAAPTLRGNFTIDLTQLISLEAIQYTHSSTGGKKRGFTLEYSKDEGVTWDTLRYQRSGEGFTKDVYDGTATENDFTCDPSSYGMVWEDGIYEYEVGLKLRFLESDGQTVRIHDFKAYGEAPSGTALNRIADGLIVKVVNNKVSFSDVADVSVFNLSGSLVKTVLNVNTLSLNDLSKGIYLVNAKSKGKICSQKVVIR